MRFGSWFVVGDCPLLDSDAICVFGKKIARLLSKKQEPKNGNYELCLKRKEAF
jgi:hypothetical protein